MRMLMTGNDCSRLVVWSRLRDIGDFKVCRFGIKSNSKDGLLAGEFKLIEINLLLPMPLLTTNTHVFKKVGYAIRLSWLMALVTSSENSYRWFNQKTNRPLMSSTSKQGHQ